MEYFQLIFLLLMKMMIGNKPRNTIVYKFPFLIKTPYIICLKARKSKSEEIIVWFNASPEV